METFFGEMRAVEHQTVPLHLTLMTPWGNVGFELPFVILPGPDSLVILGKATLGEVLGVDMMQALKQSVLKLREAAEDVGENSEDSAEVEVDEDHSDAGAVGPECLGDASTGTGDDGDAGKGPSSEISAGDDGRTGTESREGSESLDGTGFKGLGVDVGMGPVFCGCQIIQLTVDAFSDTRGGDPRPGLGGGGQGQSSVAYATYVHGAKRRAMSPKGGAATVDSRSMGTGPSSRVC